MLLKLHFFLDAQLIILNILVLIQLLCIFLTINSLNASLFRVVDITTWPDLPDWTATYQSYTMYKRFPHPYTVRTSLVRTQYTSFVMWTVYNMTSHVVNQMGSTLEHDGCIVNIKNWKRTYESFVWLLTAITDTMNINRNQQHIWSLNWCFKLMRYESKP